MNYTYNITFVTHPDKEKELADYLREFVVPALFNENSEAKNPELKKVIETGGEKPDPDHGVSIALSASFLSEKSAHEWNDSLLIPVLEKFHLKFQNECFFFVTLLENINR